MFPVEFTKFSKKFEVGFLYWIENDTPTMIQTDFQITTDKITVKPFESKYFQSPDAGVKTTLLFANHHYTEQCEMGIVKGVLVKHGDTLEIEPHDITWTFSFDVNEYPKRLARRWRR